MVMDFAFALITSSHGKRDRRAEALEKRAARDTPVVRVNVHEGRSREVTWLGKMGWRRWPG